MTIVLCLLSRVDNKLFRNMSKQNAYSQQQSHVIKQLWITLILYGIVFTSCTYFYMDGTWKRNVCAASQALITLINTVMIFQYVNIVLMVKQRYQLLKHTLSETAITDDVSYLRHKYEENVTGCKNRKVFSIETYNLESGKIGKESHNLCRIHNFRVICSELCDLLNYHNRSYQVPLLLDVPARLTFTVPTIYQGVMLIKGAILDNGPLLVYFHTVSMFSLCAFMLLTLLWLTFCCQKATEEGGEIFICIRKLLLYPNTLGWSRSDLKSFSSQLKNNKVEFNVCGFFTLNLQFFCASVSVIFTYLLVLNQLGQEV